jgi:phi13 family phage major tail protein
MPTTPNKVKFGLSKAYYAIFDETAGTYGNPVALPGAVSLSLEQQGETSTFRADNIDYWTSVSNNGYEGELELALIPDSFLTDVMGELTDATSGLQYEVADAQPKAFALLFQFEGDQNATRHVMYNCKATRPSVASQTTPDGAIEPQTETISIKASARPQDNIVKAKANSESSAYGTFFTSVQIPA